MQRPRGEMNKSENKGGQTATATGGLSLPALTIESIDPAFLLAEQSMAAGSSPSYLTKMFYTRYTYMLGLV